MNSHTNEESLKKWLEIYEMRVDLKRPLLEVEFGNYQTLINWTADVSEKNGI